MPNPLIHCENVSLGYENDVIVKNLNFDIFPGDYICVVGENGSGKSTLIKSLLGLLRPMHGKIVFNQPKKRQDIGYLPQQTVHQKDFPASVGEIVMSGFLNRCGWRPFYKREERKQAIVQMKKMQVDHLSNHCYRELSGGQQQRVLIARALCAANKILVLDEPVTGLDPMAQAELYETLKRLNEQENMAIVMVTHDFKNAVSYGEKILHLGSEDSFFGTRDEYLASDYSRYFAEKAVE
ncbi:MAG: ABC transporter ATP-binding protein [Lachnospiraceae bacterium]|nr:ABC transporter ATP-binding protein [Lachnospiraceae bacterium]